MSSLPRRSSRPTRRERLPEGVAGGKAKTCHRAGGCKSGPMENTEPSALQKQYALVKETIRQRSGQRIIVPDC